jgi:hypothetical protein
MYEEALKLLARAAPWSFEPPRDIPVLKVLKMVNSGVGLLFCKLMTKGGALQCN